MEKETRAQPRQKMLYVITKSNFGGAQRYVYDLATNLPKNQFDVVVAFGGDGVLKTKLQDAGIRTAEIKSFQRDIHIFKELRSVFELWKLYRTEQPDIVHLNSPKAGGTGSFVARLCSIPKIIYTAHGWPFLEPRNIVWRIGAWAGSFFTALFSHKVILVSQNDLERMHMPFVLHKCIVIRTSVPDIYFKTREEARSKLFNEKITTQHRDNVWLVTNAELNYNKNLFTAIDAVVDFNTKNSQKIFYAIMSDGVLYSRLITYIRKKNAESYITLLGYVDNGRSYLKAFDIFLLPSKKEGMPYAVLEAGAAGLPVVASRVGGVPEIIEHEKNGLFIDPNDHSTITKVLEKLVRNPQLRAQFGSELKKKVEDEFTLTNMVNKTVEWYSTY